VTRRGNQTMFGLAAAIWTRDVTTAHRVARALVARRAVRPFARTRDLADTVAAASIAVAEARAISTEISLTAGSTLFELAGSQATLIEHGLDRHWRNARVHTLHDPVRWKYHAVGNYYLNDEKPPLRGTI
jgi:alkylation response protein AidB-like acyl-CoA dehydrogenase